MDRITPSLAEAKGIDAKRYRAMPVCMELYADMVTPIGVLMTLRGVSRHCFILESVEDTQRWGRYTFLGFDPTLEITCRDGVTAVRHRTKGTASLPRFPEGNPNEAIRKILADYASPRVEGLPPFTGGLVGYFAYGYAKYAEPSLAFDAHDGEGFNDVDLMLFDKVIAFDHYRQKIMLIVNIRTEDVEAEYGKGLEELERLKALIGTGAKDGAPLRAPAPPAASAGALRFSPLFTEAEFCRMVERAKRYITEGDIFQVVLSNRLEAAFAGSLLDAYRVLRTTNPSPYMFYLGGEDIEIAGASPETLVKLRDGTVYTFPLAGTRPRGATVEEDRAVERELLADEKERAEHNMLVDLGRNDVGKVSRFGTVSVENTMSVVRFSHVMHIGSTVRGDIVEGKDGLDALNAVLPAGTLSGAPKIRAMHIINELERAARGIYGGAIGYLDFTGNMDTCIAIRIAYAKNGKVFVRSGAGIVADSVAQSEYRECAHKAKAVMEALGAI